MFSTPKKCVICSSPLINEEKTGKFGKKFIYHTCTNCKTSYLDNLHVQDTEKYYSEEYEKWFYQQANNLIPIKHAFSDAGPRVFLLDSFVPVKNKSILDVGCGIGGTLALLKRIGVSATGLEPSRNQSEYNRKILDLNVINGFIDKYSQNAAGKFDIITMFDVIEHLESPVDSLSKIKNLLKPEGTLFFTTPHNKKSNQSVIFQQSHLYLFSLNSINKILSDSGFNIKYIVLFGGSLNIFAQPYNQNDQKPEYNDIPPKFLEEYSRQELKKYGKKYLGKLLIRIPGLIRYFLISQKLYKKVLKKMKK